LKQRVTALPVVADQTLAKPYSANRFRCLRAVAILLLFGTAFGYLEAAVVSYLRILHEPARRHFYPDRPSGELFPLLTLEQVRAAGQEQQKTLSVEIGREATTLLIWLRLRWPWLEMPGSGLPRSPSPSGSGTSCSTPA